MKLDNIILPMQNKILHSYNTNKDFLHTYFDYANEERSYPERAKELSERPYNRQGISETIRSFMKPFGLSNTASQHIEELSNDALVVIGGQQAGVLTGPLYSVHKAITVILLAKKQRAALGIPVVPVFWVAGEDHDIHEINHVHVETNGQIVKEQIIDKFVLKLMASDAVFNQQDMATYVKNIFGKFGETVHTKNLLAGVLEAVEKEDTFTGFFVRLMNGLFADEGLLFIDSAYKPLRELESDYFCRIIEASEEIATSVVEKEEQFTRDGFGTPIGVGENAAHLFYVHETGRMLLSRRNGYFVNDSAGLRFSKEELLQIAKEEPSRLSNNVASRPLMQDLVFPVLAFVGGAGEIAYWAVLKEAFHVIGIKMPIIVPRMSITLVSRNTQKALEEKSFAVEDVMSGNVVPERLAFLDELRDDRFVAAIDKIEEKLIAEYEEIGQILGRDEKMMHELVRKNLQYHKLQFNYLKDKSEDALLIKHEGALRIYDRMEAELYPTESLQERIYTPYVYLNSYGPTLIKDLLQLPFEIDDLHKVIYL